MSIAGTHIYVIELPKDEKITNQLYGQIVNCVSLRSTITLVGDIKNNKVEMGVETVSSGWTRASLEKALNSYPTLKTKIKVSDKS